MTLAPNKRRPKDVEVHDVEESDAEQPRADVLTLAASDEPSGPEAGDEEE